MARSRIVAAINPRAALAAAALSLSSRRRGFLDAFPVRFFCWALAAGSRLDFVTDERVYGWKKGVRNFWGLFGWMCKVGFRGKSFEV